MTKARSLMRMLVIGSVLASLLAVVVTGTAFAATRAGRAAATATLSATNPGPTYPPSGCNAGYFCSYNQGNGGSLCFQTKSNVATWAPACAGHNDGAYNKN